MADLKTNLESILQEKQSKIIPENIKKDIRIFDVVGNYGGDSAVKLFSSIEEMRADNLSEPGTKAIVYSENTNIFNGLYELEEKTDKNGIAITPISNLYVDSNNYIKMLDENNCEEVYCNVDLFVKNFKQFIIDNYYTYTSREITMAVYVDEISGDYIIYALLSNYNVLYSARMYASDPGVEQGFTGLYHNSSYPCHKLTIDKDTYEISDELITFEPSTVKYPNIKFAFVLNWTSTDWNTDYYKVSTNTSFATYNRDIVIFSSGLYKTVYVNRLKSVTYKNWANLSTQLTEILPSDLVSGTVYDGKNIVSADNTVWNNIPNNIILSNILNLSESGSYYIGKSSNKILFTLDDPNDINKETINIKYLKEVSSSINSFVIVEPKKIDGNNLIHFISSDNNGELIGTTYTNNNLQINKQVNIQSVLAWLVTDDLCVYVNNMGLYTLNLLTGEEQTLIEPYIDNKLDSVFVEYNILDDTYMSVAITGNYIVDDLAQQIFKLYYYNIKTGDICIVGEFNNALNPTYASEISHYSNYINNTAYSVIVYYESSVGSSSASSKYVMFTSVIGTNTYSSSTSGLSGNNANPIIVIDNELYNISNGSEPRLDPLLGGGQIQPSINIPSLQNKIDDISGYYINYSYGIFYMYIIMRNKDVYVCQCDIMKPNNYSITITEKSGTIYKLFNNKSKPCALYNNEVLSLNLEDAGAESCLLSTNEKYQNNCIFYIMKSDGLYLRAKSYLVGDMKVKTYAESNINDYDISLVFANKDKLNISNENNIYYAILDDYTNIKDNYNKALETSEEIKGIN